MGPDGLSLLLGLVVFGRVHVLVGLVLDILLVNAESLFDLGAQSAFVFDTTKTGLAR